MVIALSLVAQSRQIVAAAVALALGWGFSLLWFWTGSRSGHVWGYAVIDAALAAYFWTSSQRRWFPVPLFFIHAALVCYFVYVALVGLHTWFWIAAFVNRLFDVALVYVAGCAIYRIRALKQRRNRI